MFTAILWLGTALGLVAGLVHAWQIVALQPGDPSPENRWSRIYRAVWAVGLWTLFGAYLLVFWLLALVLRPVVALTTSGGKAD